MAPGILIALALVAIVLAGAAWSVWVLSRASWLGMFRAGRIALAGVTALARLAAAWVYFALPRTGIEVRRLR